MWHMRAKRRGIHQTPKRAMTRLGSQSSDQGAAWFPLFAGRAGKWA